MNTEPQAGGYGWQVEDLDTSPNRPTAGMGFTVTFGTESGGTYVIKAKRKGAAKSVKLADGAAALVVTSSERAEALDLEPLAEIVTSAMCADRFAYLHTVPAIALTKALERSGLTIDG